MSGVCSQEEGQADGELAVSGEVGWRREMEACLSDSPIRS